MTTIAAFVCNGQLELSVPINLPDGTKVQIQVPDTASGKEEGPMTPEEIARTLAAMDKIEPFEMTEEERAALEADRRAQKEWEMAHFDEHAEKLRRMWEHEPTKTRASLESCPADE
jgi:hypothetical protein